MPKIANTVTVTAAGANCHSTTDEKVTNFFSACKSGDLSAVKSLLKYGADPNLAMTPNGDTPLSIATELGHLSVIELLLKNGANPLATLDYIFGSKTIFELAKFYGNEKIIKLFVEAIAEPLEKIKDLPELSSIGAWFYTSMHKDTHKSYKCDEESKAIYKVHNSVYEGDYILICEHQPQALHDEL